MRKKQKMLEVLLENAALEGREMKLENLVLKGDHIANVVNNEDIEQAIEAFTKSENSTLGYAAAGFAPVLLLLNALPFLSELDDLIVNVLAAVALLVLGAAGMYYAIYKAMFLGPRRISMEGYRIGLISEYRFFVFPRGVWNTINDVALFCIPVGYLFIVALMLRVLFS